MAGGLFASHVQDGRYFTFIRLVVLVDEPQDVAVAVMSASPTKFEGQFMIVAFEEGLAIALELMLPAVVLTTDSDHEYVVPLGAPLTDAVAELASPE
jgi:hypothetical protein